MHLRYYQTDDFLKLVDAGVRRACLAVNYATSGGKTILCLAVAAKLIERGAFDRALFLTPVVRQFLDLSDEWVHPTNDEFEPFCLGEIRSASSGVDLERWLLPRLADDPQPRILVTTHQMFVTNLSAVEKALLRDPRTLLVVDEAQSVPWVKSEAMRDLSQDNAEDRPQYILGKSVTRLERAGIVVIKASGTPTRSDELPVFTKDYVEATCSLHQLMLDGMCPQYLRTRIVHVDGLSAEDEDTYWMPLDSDKGYKEVASLWKDEYDRVPGCLRIKPRDRESNLDIVKKFLALPGFIDATGDAPGFDDVVAMEAECRRNRTAIYEDYKTMYVGMTRIVTGVDSPSRALAFFYGIPRAINVFLQFLGRILRSKVDAHGNPLYIGYPEAWLNRVEVVFVIGGLPSEAQRREEHLGVLFQALALTQSLNQAGMLGRLFARYYDGLTRRSRSKKELEVIVAGEGQGDLSASKLLLEAELDIRGTASAELDDFHYGTLPLDGKLRYVEGWLRAHTRLKAEADGVPQSEIQAIVDAAVHKHLPGLKALLVVSMASQPQHEARARSILDQIPDRSLRELVEALFEEFKADVPELDHNAYLLDAPLIEYHRTKAALIFKGVQPLASTEVILAHVQAYRNNNDTRYPDLDERDPLDPRITFKTHDQYLRTGQYSDFRGELGELLYIRCEHRAWWEDARENEDRYQALLREGSSEYATVLKSKGKNKLRRMRAAFADSLVLRLYPRAVLVATAKENGKFICSVEFLRQLSLPEANRLGGAQRLVTVLKAHQLTFDTRGIAAVRERLGFL